MWSEVGILSGPVVIWPLRCHCTRRLHGRFFWLSQTGRFCVTNQELCVGQIYKLLNLKSLDLRSMCNDQFGVLGFWFIVMRSCVPYGSAQINDGSSLAGAGFRRSCSIGVGRWIVLGAVWGFGRWRVAVWVYMGDSRPYVQWLWSWAMWIRFLVLRPLHFAKLKADNLEAPRSSHISDGKTEKSLIPRIWAVLSISAKR